MEKYYLKAEKNLESKYNDQSIAQTKKSQVFKKAAEKLKVGIGYLELNIHYKGTKSKYDTSRQGCNFCGDCCSGCNIGAKNILPYNYIFQAKKNGCEVFTQTEVKMVTKDGNHYIIKVTEPDTFGVQTKTIRAKNVVLGAGSHGSTKLLLTMKAKGLSVSERVGYNLSLNADVLGFCYNGKQRTNTLGTGQGLRRRATLNNIGPGISTVANYREKNLDKPLEDQFLLLEGSIPSPLVSVVASTFAEYAKTHKDEIHFSKEQWERVDLDDHPFQSIDEVNPEGALNHSTLFLACGHDSAGGRYVLNSIGGLKVIYDDIISEPFFKNITDKMKAVSKELGGLYVNNPRTTIFNGKMMATHPLGGCPMGDTHKTGTVNHKGQVFDSKGGVHEGLYVVDAAIIPRSLGVTPLLTITALAERISEKMIEDQII